MRTTRSPLGILWAALTLVAALYVAFRFFFADLTRLDYALMVFVHLSLAAQMLKLAWNARGNADT